MAQLRDNVCETCGADRTFGRLESLPQKEAVVIAFAQLPADAFDFLAELAGTAAGGAMLFDPPSRDALEYFAYCARVYRAGRDTPRRRQADTPAAPGAGAGGASGAR